MAPAYSCLSGATPTGQISSLTKDRSSSQGTAMNCRLVTSLESSNCDDFLPSTAPSSSLQRVDHYLPVSDVICAHSSQAHLLAETVVTSLGCLGSGPTSFENSPLSNCLLAREAYERDLSRMSVTRTHSPVSHGTIHALNSPAADYRAPLAGMAGPILASERLPSGMSVGGSLRGEGCPRPLAVHSTVQSISLEYCRPRCSMPRRLRAGKRSGDLWSTNQPTHATWAYSTTRNSTQSGRLASRCLPDDAPKACRGRKRNVRPTSIVCGQI